MKTESRTEAGKWAATIFFALLVVLFLVLATTGAASHTQQQQRRCTETIFYDNNPAASPPYIKTEWNDNTCSWQEQAFVHCRNGRSFIFAFGTWKLVVDSYSKATCPSGYNFMQGSGYQSKTCNSCTITRHWIYGNRKQGKKQGKIVWAGAGTGTRP